MAGTGGLSYLEAVHLGGALGEDDASQQEEEGVGHQAVHCLPIQEQAEVDGLNQGPRLPVKNMLVTFDWQKNTAEFRQSLSTLFSTFYHLKFAVAQ